MLGRPDGRVNALTDGFVLRQHRWPREGKPLGLAAREARISLVLTVRCGVRRFLTVYDFGLRIVFLAPCDPTSVTIFDFLRYRLGMYGTGRYDKECNGVVGVFWLAFGSWSRELLSLLLCVLG